MTEVVEGHIIYIDFGNVVTNITKNYSSSFAGGRPYEIVLKPKRISKLFCPIIRRLPAQKKYPIKYYEGKISHFFQ
jgi:S-adenosylmethionine hydrolase